MKRNGWGISMIIKPVNSNSDVVLVAAEQSKALVSLLSQQLLLRRASECD